MGSIASQTIYDIVPTILSRYASTALFVYDILITLGDEIEYVWKAQWNTPKGLYFIVRYLGLCAAIFACGISVQAMDSNLYVVYRPDGLVLPPSEFLCSCNRFDVFNSTWLLIAAALGDALLLLRTLALFRDRRKLCLSLKVMYGITYAIELALLCYYFSHPPSSGSGSGDYAGNLGCVITHATDATGPTVSDIILAVAA